MIILEEVEKLKNNELNQSVAFNLNIILVISCRFLKTAYFQFKFFPNE